MDELTEVFVQEGREQLSSMETLLLELEQQPQNRENLDAIFRAAHTVKGAAGVVECGFIEDFAHHAESLLDKLRNGQLEVTPELVSLLLACCDHLLQLLEVLAAGNGGPDDSIQAVGQRLLERIKDASGKRTASVAEADNTVASGGGPLTAEYWHVSVRFGLDLIKHGLDPLALIAYLGTLGQIVGLETVFQSMPEGTAMDPENCYLGFEIRLQTSVSKAEIEAVFSFVGEECSLHILPPHSKVAEFMQLIQELPEDPMLLGEILVRIGALTQAELASGLATQDQAKATGQDPTQPLGEILVENNAVTVEVVEAAVARQVQVGEKKSKESRDIRVHAEKLDQLIDLVGELVIAGASTQILALKNGNGELVEAASVLSRLVENIRDSALQLRMVEIGETFNRYNRVVRDVSRDLGKDIELVIQGGETELDKSVVEKIGDPLLHLVRNALDHGIESKELRLQRGKSARGRLILNACHDSGCIVIQVKDDGGGLNVDRIREKALERGLIQSAENMSEKDITNLIFEPGFSTAQEVSNLSGRGVGMDVVRRNIQALRGSVDVDTVAGQGCTFTIRLPLTLAIIDGFLVSVDKAAYVIPLEMVLECIELREATSSRNYLNLRGAVLPFVRLRDLFGVETPTPPRENVVVVQFAGQRAGIVVDQLMGEFQTVIKPLGGMFRHLRAIGGSTILGSGEVALILDVQALIRHCSSVEYQQLHRPPPELPAAPVRLLSSSSAPALNVQ